MKLENSDKRCEEAIWGVFRYRRCQFNAKYFEDEKYWCGHHAPSVKKKREEKRHAKKKEEESTLDSIRWQIKNRKRDKERAEERLKFYRKKLAELYPGETEEL